MRSRSTCWLPPSFREFQRLLVLYELPSTATQHDLRRAYVKHMKHWHPDVNPSYEAAQRFIRTQQEFFQLQRCFRDADYMLRYHNQYDEDQRGLAPHSTNCFGTAAGASSGLASQRAATLDGYYGATMRSRENFDAASRPDDVKEDSSRSGACSESNTSPPPCSPPVLFSARRAIMYVAACCTAFPVIFFYGASSCHADPAQRQNEESRERDAKCFARETASSN